MGFAIIGGLILVGCFSAFLELRDEWARRKRAK